jgi:hypothetical protein
VALLRLGPCHYPKLLERRLFIASPTTAIDAERWVERWLVKMMPRQEEGIDTAPVPTTIPDEWWRQLIDRPGICFATARDTSAAQALAHQARGHFHGVFWTGSAAEIEHRSRSTERLLFVLVSPGSTLNSQGGRHSYLVLDGAPATIATTDPLAPWVGVCQYQGFPGSMMDLMLGPRADWEPLAKIIDPTRRLYRTEGRYTTMQEAETRHLAVLQETFHSWRNQSPLCRDLIAEAEAALRYGFHHHLAAARELCLQLALFLLAEKRTAEAVTWLRTLEQEADRESDIATARRARHELSWLVDDAGHLRQDIEIGQQLAFDF